MSNLVGLNGQPLRAEPQPSARDVAALAQDNQVLRQGLFQTNILLEFVIDQINSKLRDSDGFSPIALEKFAEFAPKRAQEVMALLREQQEELAKAKQQVQLDE